MTWTPALNPTLDPKRIAPLFAKTGRVHLSRVLAAKDADVIGASIAGDAPWVKAVQVAGRALDTTIEAWDGMDPAMRSGLDAAIRDAAKTGFLYQFDAWRVSNEIEAGERRGGSLAPVEAVYDLMNSEPMLQLIRDLTGEPRAAYCDAMATRYRPGDFLTVHSDEAEGKNRLFAYVFNFTPFWRPDWGGLLLFMGPDGHIDEGYSPSYNALNIFRVPAPHAVSQVANFASSPRLSITGWIRSSPDD
ncbi:MAG: 2OG-Fe(II) oxygenase family protein [Caulobacter sp.]|nr:2OG-Fe(II) oxygenase family protein [Caulobacter sp.]